MQDNIKQFHQKDQINNKNKETAQVDIFSQIIIKEKNTGLVILKKRG